jgi:2-hydroxycyclohexanecarboxyl-CoA dehydrogenase
VTDPSTGLLDLAGRTCLVTGAGQGVGRQVALHFARSGAAGVIVNDFFVDRAEAVTEEVRAAGSSALAAPADVTSLDQVSDMIEKGHAEFGQVDVLVNNAGNMGPDPSAVSMRNFWETEPEEWERWVGVNFTGVLNCCRAALPGMVERRSGRVVTVISDAGRVGEPKTAAYSGAKAGAAGFMRAIAREVARFGITANCVSIGTTRTPTIVGGVDDAMLAAVAKRYPLGRIGEPEDVANMVLFLASDAASWITGQTYPVNGGYSFNL